VDADPLLFNRALTNLIDNSLRFTPDGGRITISVARADHATCVTVTDNGAGISAEYLPRVFDRFYRADSSRSTGGTGLGLAIVKSIAQLHGGSATIESTAENGTSVHLLFPDEQPNITNL
jgi:signal transduction histidine kinase